MVRIFPDRATCLRLVTALHPEGTREQADEWVSGRSYLDLAELSS